MATLVLGGPCSIQGRKIDRCFFRLFLSNGLVCRLMSFVLLLSLKSGITFESVPAFSKSSKTEIKIYIHRNVYYDEKEEEKKGC